MVSIKKNALVIGVVALLSQANAALVHFATDSIHADSAIAGDTICFDLTACHIDSGVSVTFPEAKRIYLKSTSKGLSIFFGINSVLTFPDSVSVELKSTGSGINIGYFRMDKGSSLKVGNGVKFAYDDIYSTYLDTNMQIYFGKGDSINVSGILTAPLSTLTIDSSSILIAENLSLGSASTLRLAAGDSISAFAAISGKIIAAGSAKDSIVFTGSSMQFNGNGTSSDSASFAYCKLVCPITAKNYPAFRIINSDINTELISQSHTGLNISNSVFNRAGTSVDSDSGSLAVSHCRFAPLTFNSAGAEGGCVYAHQSDINLSNCVFSKTSLDGAGTNAATVYVTSSTLSIDSSSFDSISIAGITDGAFIYLDTTTATIKNSTLSNADFSSSGTTGSLVAHRSKIDVFNCKFTNTSPNSNSDNINTSAVLNLEKTSGKIVNTEISRLRNNKFGDEVFSVYLNYSSLEFTNVTFTKVSDHYSDGYNYTYGIGMVGKSSPVFTNCVLWETGVGPIAEMSPFDTSSRYTFVNSLVCQDSIDTITTSQRGLNTRSRCIFENCINSDPMFVDTAADDFSPAKGSPLINAGSADTAGLGLTPFDLAGNPRIFAGDPVSARRIDIGAYEYQGVTPILKTVSMLKPAFSVSVLPQMISIMAKVNPALSRLSLFGIDGKRIASISGTGMCDGYSQFRLSRFGIASGVYVARIYQNDVPLWTSKICLH